MSTEEINVLLKQLVKQQAELEAKEHQLNVLLKENEKLKKCAPKKIKNSRVYSTVRKSGKVVYGFTIYDENLVKIKRERFSTKYEAEAELRKLLDLKEKRQLSLYQSNQKQTFQVFCNAYINKAEAEFSINTIEAAKGIIKNHLSYFKDIYIKNLNKQKVEEWSCVARVKMKPFAFNNTLKLARAIWNNAIKKDLTNIPNPFLSIEPINIKKECKIRKTIRIDKEQADLLISSALNMFEECDYTPFIIACAIYGAMREGEILGLMWSDFDFNKSQITIQRQVQKVTKKILTKKLKENPQLTERDILLTDRLKTECSKATLVFPRKLMQMMKQYKKILMSHNRCHELCFCTADGSPLVARDFVRYKFEKVLKAVFDDCHYMHFHELRGSCATILHMEKVPSKIIQELLRHEKQSTTDDIYIEVDKTSKEVQNYLDSVFTA